MTLTNSKIVYQHFARHDPLLHATLIEVDLSDWFEASPSEDHFYNLARNIIYQQLAGAVASTIFSRFEKLLGGKIKPEQVIKLEDQQLRDVGLSWAKAKYLKDLASQVLNQTVDLTRLDRLSNEDVITELTKVKGIGRWTAEMFLLFTLHRENIFSYGDLGLKKGFAKLYSVSDPKPAQIEAVVRLWSPYESYGSIALWYHLDNR